MRVKPRPRELRDQPKERLHELLKVVRRNRAMEGRYRDPRVDHLLDEVESAAMDLLKEDAAA